MTTASSDATQLMPEHVRALVNAMAATVSAGETLGRIPTEPLAMDASLPILSIDTRDVAEAEAAPPNQQGQRADLQVVGVLGVGGMGTVYSARQRALGREVALKRPLEGASMETRAALLGEGRIMGGLEHPNIVPVHALGADRDGQPVLVMKRVDGVVWRELLQNPEHPMWSKLGKSRERGLAFHLAVLTVVCNALHFAHSRGVVHRDLKPDNVMIGAFGEVYLLDWGIARTSSAKPSARVVGTPAYMAPEMLLTPDAVDERADVYLLGAALHEVLVGAAPHEGATIAEVFASALSEEPRAYPPSAPPDLVALCRAAMQREPSRRPSTEEFRDTLASYGTRRASRRLAAHALGRLDDLDARVGTDDAAFEDPEVGVVLAECRFGFEMSLREWIDNELARKGLARCLERSITRELRLRNAAAAGALLAALPEPRPELAGRLASLERELEAERALAASHARRDRELDASVSAWPRVLFFAAFTVVGGGLSLGAYLDELRTKQLMSMNDQVKLDLGFLVFLFVALAVGRRRLLGNAYNRNIFALWVIAILGVLFVDVFLRANGIGAATATPIDFAIMSVAFGVGAALFSLQLLWICGLSGVAAVLSAVFPRQSTLFATFAIILSAAVSMDSARRSAAKAPNAA